jgi:hypothetical protein
MRKLLIGATLAVVLSVGAAGPAFAFDCFNPNKRAGAGSSATIVLDENGDEVSFTETKNGNGAFITIDASALGAGSFDIHSMGAGNNPHGVVGGPGSQKPEHACDGKGIDYLEACFGGG